MKSGNAIVLAIQPRVLLVLVGCNAATSEVGQTKFHAEAKDDGRYPPAVEYPAAIHFPTDLEPETTALAPTELVHGSGAQVTETSPTKSPDISGGQDWAGDLTAQMESAFPTRTKSREVQPGAQSDDEPVQPGSVPDAGADESLTILNFQRSKLENMADMLRQTLRKSNFVVQEY